MTEQLWEIALRAFMTNTCPECEHSMGGHGAMGCVTAVLPKGFRGSVSDSGGGSRGDSCRCRYNPFVTIGGSWSR